MSNVWNKTPPAPLPELNPLMNPLLEQNLGRWAKVYFNTPPAKREQAINNLLEEIKRESSGAASARPYFPTDVRFQRAVCTVCHHHNPPGHKFCSRCGLTLVPEQPASPEPPETPAPLPRPSVDDVQWLPDHSFGGSSLSDSYPPARPGRKYVAGLALLVLAGFAYMRWNPELWTKVATTRAPQVSAPATSLPPQSSLPVDASVEPKIQTGTIAPKSVGPIPEKLPAIVGSFHHRTPAPAGIQPATQKSSLLDVTPRPTAADQGSPDLRLAQRYLGGSMGVRDPAEAAKLLWKAVSKQNATAAVLLSDLYLRGDGVPRSCDQARLLLVAAAKRGSPLAAQQLRNLESCR